MENYFIEISSQLGINVWLFVVILVWSSVWKLLGLWKAAKNNSVPWFIAIGILNTIGILPILYIYVFSKIEKLKPVVKKKSSKGKVRGK